MKCGQILLEIIFLPSGPKVLLSLPAHDRECCIFGLTRQKNRILTMGANKECPRSHVNCHPSRRRGVWLPRCVIYYFCPPRKAPTSRPLRETKWPLSGAVEQKNSTTTLASKKESLRSYVCQPRLLGRQLHVTRDISYFTGLGV